MTITETQSITWTDDNHQAYIAIEGGAVIVKVRCPHAGHAACTVNGTCRVAQYATEASDEELWDDTAKDAEISFPAPLLWGWSQGEPIITPKAG